MNWQKPDILQVGDIVETSYKTDKGKVVNFIKHYGIIIEQWGKLNVLHSPGVKPLIEPIDKVFNGRRCERVLSTGMSNDEVLSRWRQCENEHQSCSNTPYSLWQFNCEDFIRKVCDCNIGIDQRKYWTVGTITTIMVTVLIVVVIVKLIRN